MTSNPTQEYDVYQQAYDYFNRELFGGQLPPCLITLQRMRSAYGYFAPRSFTSRNEDDHQNGDIQTDEIALNPDTFIDRDDRSILSTLVHELVHLWRQHFGTPG